MAVYKFRVTFEDHDDVYREIEIKSKSTFEDLHNAIQEAISFDNIKDASFYISDDHWRKGEEIRLKNSSDNGVDKNSNSVKMMKDSKLAKFIEDPHQKFLYIYDSAAHWSFLIELVKILPDDPKAQYPKCSKSVGVAPKQYKKNVPPPNPDEDDDHAPTKEKIFHADEGYDEPEEDEDALIEGDEDEHENTEDEAEEFGDNEHLEDR